jgi:hypothetical protein
MVEKSELKLISYCRQSQCWREDCNGTHYGRFDEKKGWIPELGMKVEKTTAQVN